MEKLGYETDSICSRSRSEARVPARGFGRLSQGDRLQASTPTAQALPASQAHLIHSRHLHGGYYFYYIYCGPGRPHRPTSLSLEIKGPDCIPALFLRPALPLSHLRFRLELSLLPGVTVTKDRRQGDLKDSNAVSGLRCRRRQVGSWRPRGGWVRASPAPGAGGTGAPLGPLPPRSGTSGCTLGANPPSDKDPGPVNETIPPGPLFPNKVTLRGIGVLGLQLLFWGA